MLREKYSEVEWVKSCNEISIGDIIAFYDEDEKIEIHAEVIGVPHPDLEYLVLYRKVESYAVGLLNLYNTICYKIKSDKDGKEVSCCCGAKYTSNPKYHLSYCPIK